MTILYEILIEIVIFMIGFLLHSERIYTKGGFVVALSHFGSGVGGW
jgi:hypothetical protein